MKNARQRSCSTLANGSVKTRARQWTSGRRTRPMSNRVFEVGKPDRNVHDCVMAGTPNPLLSSRRCERTPTLPLHCRRRPMRASYPDVVRFHPSRISAHSLEKEEKSFLKTKRKERDLTRLAGCTRRCRTNSRPGNNQFEDGSTIAMFSFVGMPRAATAEQAQELLEYDRLGPRPPRREVEEGGATWRKVVRDRVEDLQPRFLRTAEVQR